MNFYFNEYIGEQMISFNFDGTNLIEFNEEMEHLAENKIQGIITSFNPERLSFEVSFPGYGEYFYPAVESIPHIISL
jgi:hypothetical protein